MGEPPATRGWMLWLTAAGFTLLQCPLILAVRPSAVHQHRPGWPPADAGLILGLCAALEIPLMLGFGWLSTRMPLSRLILAGAMCGVVYYGLAGFATDVWQLAAGQVLNALFIAAVSGLGISYMQDMLPRFPGGPRRCSPTRSRSVRCWPAPLFGLAQEFGYRLAYFMSAALCALGFMVLLVTRNDHATRRLTGQVPWDPCAYGWSRHRCRESAFVMTWSRPQVVPSGWSRTATAVATWCSTTSTTRTPAWPRSR